MTDGPPPRIPDWKPADFAAFHRALGGRPVGAERVSGYAWRGLGLFHDGWGRPRSKTRWTVLHIGSGLLVARLRGAVACVFPVASDLAEATDWTAFDMPGGWRQTDPELPAKLNAIRDAAPAGVFTYPPAAEGWHADRPQPISDDEARAFFAAREALGLGAAA